MCFFSLISFQVSFINILSSGILCLSQVIKNNQLTFSASNLSIVFDSWCPCALKLDLANTVQDLDDLILSFWDYQWPSDYPFLCIAMFITRDYLHFFQRTTPLLHSIDNSGAYYMCIFVCVYTCISMETSQFLRMWSLLSNAFFIELASVILRSNSGPVTNYTNVWGWLLPGTDFLPCNYL